MTEFVNAHMYMGKDIMGFNQLRKAIVAADSCGFHDWKKYGEVSVKRSDCGKFLIFNYLPTATYQRRWNWLERVSRGLIMDAVTGEVHARSFDKFFNWGEMDFTPTEGLSQVWEKMDGSMGVIYSDSGDLRVATRGSFNSDQAIWATEHLNSGKYELEPLWRAMQMQNASPVVEIIYPENRIVVDYGEAEELVLLDMSSHEFNTVSPVSALTRIADAAGMRTPEHFDDIKSVDELLFLAQQIDHNFEGWVCKFANGERCKIKGLQYLQLHKIIHGLTPKMITKIILEGKLDEILIQVPEEFREDLENTNNRIKAAISMKVIDVATAFEEAPQKSKKEFVFWVRAHCPDLFTLMMARFDGKDIIPLIKKDISRTYSQFF